VEVFFKLDFLLQECKRRGKRVWVIFFLITVRPLSREITMSQAYQNMCAGMFKTMVAFDMDGKVRKPKFELDSEQVRYEHRFAPFNSVMTPPPVHYLQFKVTLLVKATVKEVVLGLLRDTLFVPSHCIKTVQSDHYWASDKAIKQQL